MQLPARRLGYVLGRAEREPVGTQARLKKRSKIVSENLGLAVVVGAARSGTTLTRLLLDSHPEIGAPAEAGLPSLMSHLAQVWWTVHADETRGRGRDDPGGLGKDRDPTAKWEEPKEAAETGDLDEQVIDLPAAAKAWIVNTVKVPMLAYCRRGGKSVYCDKSLDSVHHLPIVRELFPQSKFVFVFRHVMDTVASGIEASPWGFNAYGYAPYVQASPGNSVAALASYWLDHVDRALGLEERYGEQCYRITYEELVLQPERTVAGLLHFLGVREDLSVLRNAFDRQPARGPGDFKVEHTNGVHAASIGRGKRVPISMLPPRLLEALNEKLAALGYEPLDRGWNAAERAVDNGGRGFWGQRLADIMSGARIAAGVAEIAPFAVLADDHRPLRWVVEPSLGTITQGDGEVQAVLTGTAEDLVLMLTEGENLGVLLRTGRVRHVTAEENGRPPANLINELNALVALLRGSTRPNGQDVLEGVDAG